MAAVRKGAQVKKTEDQHRDLLTGVEEMQRRMYPSGKIDQINGSEAESAADHEEAEFDGQDASDSR